MSVSIKSLGIDRLTVEERLSLVEEIWDSITADRPVLPLSEAQRAELDRRLADDHAHPGEVLAWDDLEASVAARLGK